MRMNGLLVNLGIMAYEAGDLDLAQRHYQQALEFLRRSGSDRELLDCLNNLGEICLLRMEFEAAREYWEECLSICAATGFVQGTIEPLIYLGTLHILSNSNDKGQQYLERAWQAAEGTHALKEQALVEEQHGVMALRERSFEQARLHFEKALSVFNEMKLSSLSARLELKISELAWYEGDKAFYKSTLDEVEKKFQNLESRWLIAELNRLKGFDLRSDQSEEALNRAVEMGQPFPDLLWRAYWLRGRYYHHRHSFGNAGENYQKAMETIRNVLARMPADLRKCYSRHAEISLLRDNAAKLKAELISTRSQNHVR